MIPSTESFSKILGGTQSVLLQKVPLMLSISVFLLLFLSVFTKIGIMFLGLKTNPWCLLSFGVKYSALNYKLSNSHSLHNRESINEIHSTQQHLLMDTKVNLFALEQPRPFFSRGHAHKYGNIWWGAKYKGEIYTGLALISFSSKVQNHAV